MRAFHCGACQRWKALGVVATRLSWFVVAFLRHVAENAGIADDRLERIFEYGVSDQADAAGAGSRGQGLSPRGSVPDAGSALEPGQCARRLPEIEPVLAVAPRLVIAAGGHVL